MYCLFDKYYKPIRVQFYTVSCVNWVPKTTLLDLQTNWTTTMLLEWNASVCRGLTVVSPHTVSLQ